MSFASDESDINKYELAWVAKCVYDGRMSLDECEEEEEVGRKILCIAHNKPIFVSASSEHEERWRRRSGARVWFTSSQSLVTQAESSPRGNSIDEISTRQSRSNRISTRLVGKIESAQTRVTLRACLMLDKLGTQNVVHALRPGTVKIYFFFTWLEWGKW